MSAGAEPGSTSPTPARDSQAEIITVGSELLAPGRIDAHSSYLTAELSALGIRVAGRTVIGDRLEDLTHAIRAALQRTRMVVLTGGLGPTDDDRTREAAAAALQRGLHRDAGLARALQRRFAHADPGVRARNLRQADLIDGAEILVNELGTAPGQWWRGESGIVILLPGPPRELQRIFAQEVAPRLARLGARALERRILAISGLTESEVDEQAAPLYPEDTAAEVTILAVAPGRVELRIAAQAETPAAASAAADQLAEALAARLGANVHSRGGEPLEAVVGRRLGERRQTVAVAESCTGGMVAEAITALPGASAYFRGGAVCYANDLKTDFAGVPPALLAAHGAVSAPVAAAMAEGIRARCRADWGISVTGVAGPDGGSDLKPVGTVYIAVSGDSLTRVYDHRFAPIYGAGEGLADRRRIRQLTVVWAWLHLYRLLEPEPIQG